MRISIFLIAVLLLTQGCESFPKDPDETLKKVKNGTLIVGYSENPPWVIKTENEPAGVEAELIKEFAKSLHADIQWKNDTEQNLFESLKNKEIHLIIAGITEKTPWKKEAGFTRPYIEHQEKKHVMAVLQGENAFLVELEKFLHQQKQQVNNHLAL